MAEPSAATLETIKATIRDELPIDEDAEITDDMPLIGGGMDLDSLDVLLLLTSLEKAFGIKLSGSDLGQEAFASVRTLATTVDLLRARPAADGAAAATVEGVDLDAALERLPHGPGFRYLTRVTGLVPDTEGQAEWRLSGEEAFFADHFPGRPVVPGVLIGEALAQLSGLVAIGAGSVSGARLAELQLRWPASATPPATILLASRQTQAHAALRRFEVRARIGDTVVAEGALSLVLDADDGAT